MTDRQKRQMPVLTRFRPTTLDTANDVAVVGLQIEALYIDGQRVELEVAMWPEDAVEHGKALAEYGCNLSREPNE